MQLIVGLGNYGKEYLKTRHNAGFIVVDYLSNNLRLTWNHDKKMQANIAYGTFDNSKLIFCKPNTYMNCSGAAVLAVVSYYRIRPEDILVIHDDIDLELGKIKIKFAGGSGGHNGLRSIDHLLSKDYHRLRIGIGRPGNSEFSVSDYVLGSFTDDEYNCILNSIKVVDDNFSLLIHGQIEDFKHKI
jgi:PTH1 family peptidyl-tRNA hydrolase